MLPVSPTDSILSILSLTSLPNCERSVEGVSCCWHSPDDKARLGLLHGNSGNNLLLAIGLNPSQANHQKADPTWSRIRRLAELQGYHGVLLLNIFPQRATYIRDLSSEAHPVYHDLNLRFWEAIASRVPKADVWCAWGATLHHRTYLPSYLQELMAKFSGNSYRYWSWGELLSSNHPRHPLSRGKYAFKYSDEFVPFDLLAYLYRETGASI